MESNEREKKIVRINMCTSMKWMEMRWAKVIQTLLSVIKHVAYVLYSCNEQIIQCHSFTSVSMSLFVFSHSSKMIISRESSFPQF